MGATEQQGLVQLADMVFRETLRRKRLEGLPPAFELIDLGDEIDQIGAEYELGLSHAGTSISDFMPDKTQILPFCGRENHTALTSFSKSG
jgi:hypothetical protein